MKSTTKLPDGTEITEYCDKSIKTCYPDGTCITEFVDEDGDVGKFYIQMDYISLKMQQEL